MKLFLFFCLVIFPVLLSAQAKQKVEKEFLNSLNTVLNKSDKIHWSDAGKMSVDTPFHINQAGMLSVTVTYQADSSLYKIRMIAPVSKIQSVIQDEYFILLYKDNDVVVFETNSNGQWINSDKRNLFHFGHVRDNGKLLSDTQQALLKIKNFITDDKR